MPIDTNHTYIQCIYSHTSVYLYSQRTPTQPPCKYHVLLCTTVFFCTSALFPLPAVGRSSCFRLRGTQGARPNTTAQACALAEVHGACSGGSKSQITTGRHCEHVEPSRRLQTHVHFFFQCPTAHAISRILNVANDVRHYLVMERYFPDTNLRDMLPLLVQYDTIYMTSEGWSLLTHDLAWKI